MPNCLHLGLEIINYLRRMREAKCFIYYASAAALWDVKIKRSKETFRNFGYVNKIRMLCMQLSLHIHNIFLLIALFPDKMAKEQEAFKVKEHICLFIRDIRLQMVAKSLKKVDDVNFETLWINKCVYEKKQREEKPEIHI